MSKFITNLSASTALTGVELLETAQLSLAVRISAATISAAAADNSYNDSANGFVAAGFAVGDRVNVVGFVASVVNNILVGTVTAVAAGKLTIGGTDGDVIVDNVAGDTVVISKWLSARATADSIVGRAAFAGFAAIVSPAQITANQNNYNPANLATAAFLRINSDAGRDVTGLVATGATAGRQLIVLNVGTFAITLKSEDAGSTAANRFAIPADIVIPANGCVKLIYDTVSSRWRSVGLVSGGGGGGGAQSVVDYGYLKSATATDGHFVPNGTNNTPSAAAGNAGNLKVTFTIASTQVVIFEFMAVLARNNGGQTRVQITDTAGAKIWPKYPQSPDAADANGYHTMVYSTSQGEGDGYKIQFGAALLLTAGTYTYVIQAYHALQVGTTTWYDRMFRAIYV